MHAFVLAGLILTVPLGASAEPVAPGDGLVLSPTPVVRSPVNASNQSGPRRPLGYGTGIGAGVSSLLAGALLLQSRRKRDDEPLFVLVHGNGGSARDFDTILERLDVSKDRVVAFDYTTAGKGRSSTIASRLVSTERAAWALDDLIRDLSTEHSNIYSIHHSRGGAVGASMIGNLDDGTAPPIDGYVGAALLDPAIAGGVLGSLQRAGGFSDLIPDNGGFDTTKCTDAGCRDVRERLGESSDVEVIAIRNLDAEVTNFRDNPEGLRVYDLEHDGGIAARFLVPLSPYFAYRRIWNAHGSVLEHEAVTDCIKAEVEAPGSCVWNDERPRRAVWSGRGGAGGRMRPSVK